jgi:hypothetical protein
MIITVVAPGKPTLEVPGLSSVAIEAAQASQPRG